MIQVHTERCIVAVTVNLSSSEALKATLNIYRSRETIKRNRLSLPDQIIESKFQRALFPLTVSSIQTTETQQS